MTKVVKLAFAQFQLLKEGIQLEVKDARVAGARVVRKKIILQEIHKVVKEEMMKKHKAAKQPKTRKIAKKVIKKIIAIKTVTIIVQETINQILKQEMGAVNVVLKLSQNQEKQKLKNV